MEIHAGCPQEVVWDYFLVPYYQIVKDQMISRLNIMSCVSSFSKLKLDPSEPGSDQESDWDCNPGLSSEWPLGHEI